MTRRVPRTYNHLLLLEHRGGARGVTRAVIAAVCDALEAAFGAGYVFGPEPITEGGIQMLDWPGRDAEKRSAYKSLRFHPAAPYVTHWPWIDADPAAARRSFADSEAAVFGLRGDEDAAAAEAAAAGRRRRRRRRLILGLFAKAFGGAPVWTRDAARRVAVAFAACGFRRRGRLPRDDDLVNDWETDDS